MNLVLGRKSFPVIVLVYVLAHHSTLGENARYVSTTRRSNYNGQILTTSQDTDTNITSNQSYLPEENHPKPKTLDERRRIRQEERRRVREETRRRRKQDREQERLRSRHGLCRDCEENEVEVSNDVTRSGPVASQQEVFSSAELAANLSALWTIVRKLEAQHQNIVPNHIGVDASLSTECDPDSCQEGLHRTCARHDCSGNGRCCCGECICREGFYGADCSCRDDNCPRTNSKMCNGRGVCHCGKCRCDSGFTGESCGCSEDISTCKAPNSLLVCAGQGICECGKCKCEQRHMSIYTGEYCEHSSFSAGICEQLKKCVLCQALGKNLPQCELCANTFVRRVANLDSSHMRCRMVHSGCLLLYSYKRVDDDKYDVTVPDDLTCGEK